MKIGRMTLSGMIVLGMSMTLAHGSVITVHEDDFESYSLGSQPTTGYGNFFTGDNTTEISDDQANSGSQSLFLQDQTGTPAGETAWHPATIRQGLSGLLDNNEPTRFSAWFYLDPDGNTFGSNHGPNFTLSSSANSIISEVILHTDPTDSSEMKITVSHGENNSPIQTISDVELNPSFTLDTEKWTRVEVEVSPIDQVNQPTFTVTVEQDGQSETFGVGQNWYAFDNRDPDGDPLDMVIQDINRMAVGFASDADAASVYTDDWLITVPEPASMALLGAGASLMAFRRRRKS